MKFKILYESHDDKGTYGFLTKSSFSEFKKVTKKLVALLDKYDKVIDKLEAKADSEGTQELLEKNAYYNSLIKAYSNSYETILSLDNAFKNNYIRVDTFHPSDEVVVDLSIYKVDDLYDLLYDLQDTLSKSNNLDEGLNTNMKFLVENELEKRHKKHKKTIKPGAMGSFIHPDGGNKIAIDTFNNSVDMSNMSSTGLGEDLNEDYVEDKLKRLISVQHFISPKDDIQLFTTEKGNYLVKRNGKQMMILDKKNFRESEIEDLRLNGYFRDYDEARMNEALTEDTIKQNNKYKLAKKYKGVSIVSTGAPFNSPFTNYIFVYKGKPFGLGANTIEEAEKEIDKFEREKRYMFKESLAEDYLMKSNIDYKKQRAASRNDSKWLQELDKIENYFKEHPDFYICDQFGTIGTRDKRYQEIFNELKNRGLKPRMTFFIDRLLTTDAITVDSIDNKIPKEVYEILRNYPELTLWDRVAHKASKCYKIKFDMRDQDYNNIVYNKSLTEDTIKQNGKWVNKGKEGTHGKFNTKKQADAQRKAMFANGYRESLDNGNDPHKNIDLGYIKGTHWSVSIYDKTGTIYLNQHHPYDDAEYCWAYSTDKGKTFIIVRDRKVLETFKADPKEKYQDIIARMSYLDKNTKSRMLYDSFNTKADSSLTESANENSDTLAALRNFKKHAEIGDQLNIDINGNKGEVSKEADGWYLYYGGLVTQGSYKIIEAAVKDAVMRAEAKKSMQESFDPYSIEYWNYDKEEIDKGVQYCKNHNIDINTLNDYDFENIVILANKYYASKPDWKYTDDEILAGLNLLYDEGAMLSNLDADSVEYYIKKANNIEECYKMTNKEIKEALNNLDMWAIDNDATFYDLKTLYEAFINPKSPIDQKKKDKIQKALNDPTMNRDTEKLQDYIAGILARQDEALEETFDDEEDYFSELQESAKKIIIPKPYNKYFEVDTINTSEDDDYKYGDKIDGYDCHFLACLMPKDEDGEIYPILTDDPDYPVCELVGGRLIPVDL